MCIYTSTAYVYLYIDNPLSCLTSPWKKFISANISAKFRNEDPDNIQIMSIGAHGIPHCKILMEKKTLKHDHGGKQTQPTIKRVSYWR